MWLRYEYKSRTSASLGCSYSELFDGSAHSFDFWWFDGDYLLDKQTYSPWNSYSDALVWWNKLYAVACSTGNLQTYLPRAQHASWWSFKAGSENGIGIWIFHWNIGWEGHWTWPIHIFLAVVYHLFLAFEWHANVLLSLSVT